MQQHQGQPPAPAGTNTLGALSFLLGAFGVLAALFGLPFPAMLLGGAGVVCAIIGLTRSQQLGGTGISVAGLLVAGAALLGGLVS